MVIRGRVPARAIDAAAMLAYVLGAGYVLSHLWLNPNGRYLELNYQDQYQFEWFLTHATQVFTQGESPFFSDQINYPLGVNLMANTSVLTLSLLLTPVTLLLGAGVTFAVISTLAIAGTAIAWYWALTRELGRSRPAAFVGAGFLGFAPAMMSQLAGHPNIAGQYLIPLIIVTVLRMRHPGKVWRQGLILALLVVLQAGINEEMLFFTAIGLGVFVLAFVPWRELPGHARAMLPKLGVTLVAAGVALAYPLWFQFFGPQAYHGLDNGVRAINIDALSYFTFGRYSIAGDVAEAARLNRNNASEENSFFGLPLMILVAGAAIALWRNRQARALFITGGIFAVMSLGASIRLNAVDHKHVPGPWKWISKLPLFDSVVPTRLALIVTAVLGVGLAVMVDRLIVDRLRPAGAAVPNPRTSLDRDPDPDPEPVPVLVGAGPKASAAPVAKADAPPAAQTPPAPARRRSPRAALVWSVAVFAALAPLFPTAQPAKGRPPIPALFTDGHWRTELPTNAVLAPMPGGWVQNLTMMSWSTATGMEVRLTAGYFLVPNDTEPDDPYAHFGPGYRDTIVYLDTVGRMKSAPKVTEEHRADMHADIRFWKATTLGLPADQHNVDVLRKTIDELVAPEVAPAHLAYGMWIWDVRPISGTA